MSDFNFEDFISGAQLARSTVGAYLIDNRDEIARLKAEYASKATGDRESSKGGSDVADRIKALQDEMEASRREFVIRTLTPSEYRQHMDDPDPEPYAQLATQSVEPKLTADQWRRFGEAVGASQFGVLVAEANALVVSKVAVPDFSPNA